MRKLLLCVLTITLSANILAFQVRAEAAYRNDEMGFSIVLPSEYEKDIEISVDDNIITFIHKPSVIAGWGGVIETITVLSPRSLYLTGDYDCEWDRYFVIGMSQGSVFICRGSVGGVGSPEEQWDAYFEVSSSLGPDILLIDDPDVIPEVDMQSNLPYLTSEDGQIRPDEPMTRGEAAMALYCLVKEETKTTGHTSSCSDLDDAACAQAVGYFESYGILSGYPDGTFRPNAELTRAEFVVMLQRLLFEPRTSWLGPGISFTDINAEDDHWALAYLTSACERGWLSGYSDGSLRPDGNITRAEASVILNRMLGRDITAIELPTESPFTDIAPTHWAYNNILAAAC